MADQIPDSAKRDAIDILTTYVDFIRNDVRADDFERHPYLPHIEQTIEDLRAAPPAMDREAVEKVRVLVAEINAGKFDELDSVADKWSAEAGVQRMSNAICSVFEKYAPHDVMDRFREKVAALMHLSFVEGAAQGVLQLKPVIAHEEALRSIVVKHTRIGGYPDTDAIARDAYNLALSTLSADAIRQGEGELRNAIRNEVINTPETADFMAGVPLEAAHQRDRWGVDHDAGKGPLDWFWLIGYLAQKAADAAMRGDTEKAKHHTISTAAALANWHAALTGADNRMRPGIATPASHASDGGKA